MKFFKNRFGKGEETEALTPTPSREVKGIQPIVVYAVELLFSNHEYRNEIFASLVKNGKKHNTRNILVFIYYCTVPFEERSYGQQKLLTVEQYLQETHPPLDNTVVEKKPVSEELAKKQLLKFLSLDSTEVYYFLRDLADYPGETDMQWITKIENRKQERLRLA